MMRILSLLVKLVNSLDAVNDIVHTLGKRSRGNHEAETCDNRQPGFLKGLL